MTKRTMRTVGALAVLAVCAVLAACNTSKGFGKDLEETGDNISDAAERAKPD